MKATLTRRQFVRSGLALGAGVMAGAGAARPCRAAGAGLSMKEARYWEALSGGRTRCVLCPNFCERGDGAASLCKTRVNKGGKLYTLTYGKPCVITPDPLMKNPLYHVTPGQTAIGVATAGCNLTCKYCQNWDISQESPDRTKNMDVSPEDLVAKVQARGLGWITFSYTEPVVYYEYALATAALARKKGLRVAMSTAGFICEQPLAELIRAVDAFSVTLKGATQDFYAKVCGGNVDEVWRSVRQIAKAGVWMEVVHLMVPGMNDDEASFKAIAGGLAKINRDIPLHFLRFAPAYKLKHIQPTPVATLERARTVALKEGLKFVYLDLSGHEAANTACPRCHKTVIERGPGFTVISNRLKKGHCPFCGAGIPGVFA